jgi:ribosomal protein L11 methyltransferase
VLDIGTGSGVLAIAALKLGVEQGIGLDIDPCARAEASENAALNGLSQRMEIAACSIDTLEGMFFLVAANLRFPTLKAYFNTMARLTECGGYMVLSGIKSNEIESLKGMSRLHGMSVCWEAKEMGWGALVLRREKGVAC